MSGGRFSPDGLYLALETSGQAGSVALARGGEVVAYERLALRGQHAAKLLPAVDACFAEAAVARTDLSGVVVGEGPGSFTGVRVAAATAKGIAAALDLPLWAVSSLAAGALAGAEPLDEVQPAIVYVLFDARGDRVYGACYGVGRRGVETLTPPHAGSLRDVLAGEVPAGAVFAGDAAQRHHRAISSAGFRVAELPLGIPGAKGLLRYLVLHPDTPPVADRPAWEPRYLRASNAEREWARREGARTEAR